MSEDELNGEPHSEIIRHFKGKGYAPATTKACIEYIHRLLDGDPEDATQKQVADECDVSVTTISRNYEMIWNYCFELRLP